MSIKIFSTAALAGVAIMAAQSVSAAVFDFASMADNMADTNYIGGTELNWADTTFAAGLTIDGVTLIASGSNVDGTFADAFFDKGGAGLGVCSTADVGGGSGCASPSGPGKDTGDDNVNASGSGETLRLAFDAKVSLSGLIFRNGGHSAVDGSIKVNGTVVTISGGSVSGGFAALSGASVYDFEYTGDEFYISAVLATVPVPAAGLLLLGAIGALGVAGRRRKKAA